MLTMPDNPLDGSYHSRALEKTVGKPILANLLHNVNLLDYVR